MTKYLKDFLLWFGIKPKLDAQQKFPRFEEGEIWWCHVGENIGHEEDGKGDKFLRPVIIAKKFNSRLFYGIPTSTQIKNSPYYFQITIKGKQISALLSQMRAFDVKRLSYKQARLPDAELIILKKCFTKMFQKK
jgi:mRNA-degrading endonuclease toxin of MazEF toxin-antitoxin module